MVSDIEYSEQYACYRCGHALTWDSDYMASECGRTPEDVNLKEDYIGVSMSCPHCGLSVEIWDTPPLRTTKLSVLPRMKRRAAEFGCPFFLFTHFFIRFLLDSEDVVFYFIITSNLFVFFVEVIHLLAVGFPFHILGIVLA